MEYTVEGVQVHENPSGLLITSIEGLGPGKATINKTDLPTSDGVVVNSVRLSEKNIVIHGKFLNSPSIEDARILSYRMFPIKQKVTFLIETDNRTATIVGYVESNEPLIFSDSSEVQISIVCESAYFTGKEINVSLPHQEAEELLYAGDADNGMEIHIKNKHIGLPSNRDTRISNISVSNTAHDNTLSEIKVNTENLANYVENTSPTDLFHTACSFAFGETEGERFIGDISSPTDDVIHNLSALRPIIINDELHYFTLYNRESIRHYKYDDDKGMIVRLPDATYNGERSEYIYCTFEGPTANWSWGTIKWNWLLNYNGNIYLYVSPYVSGNTENQLVYEHHAMFRYDVDRNEFVDLPESYFIPTKYDTSSIFVNGKCWFGNTLVRLNGRVYAFISTKDLTGSVANPYIETTYIYEFTGDSWVLHSSSPLGYEEAIYNKSFTGSTAVEYHGKVHLMVYEKDYVCHYTWDGEVWERTKDNIRYPFTMLNNGVVLHDNLYYLCGDKLYRYDEDTDDFIAVRTLPGITYSNDYGSYGYEGPLIAYKDVLFCAGSNTSYPMHSEEEARQYLYYTEAPNNTSLVANDEIVISTYKGNKTINFYRNGVKHNILNLIDKNSKWMQLCIGVNKFEHSEDIDGDVEALEITIKSHELYEGV